MDNLILIYFSSIHCSIGFWAIEANWFAYISSEIWKLTLVNKCTEWIWISHEIDYSVLHDYKYYTWIKKGGNQTFVFYQNKIKVVFGPCSAYP